MTPTPSRRLSLGLSLALLAALSCLAAATQRAVSGGAPANPRVVLWTSFLNSLPQTETGQALLRGLNLDIKKDTPKAV